MPESRSTPSIPRGTQREIRRESLVLLHLTDDQFRSLGQAEGWPAHMVEVALSRRADVLRSGFLTREPHAARFERAAHVRHHGLDERVLNAERAA